VASPLSPALPFLVWKKKSKGKRSIQTTRKMIAIFVFFLNKVKKRREEEGRTFII